MSNVVAQDEFLKVSVDADLKAEFEAALDRQGTTQRVGITRLLTWFVRQHQDVQAMILSQLTPEGTATLATRVLANFSKYKGGFGDADPYVKPPPTPKTGGRE